MDKNQATGLILFAAVILVYSLFFASTPEPVREDQAVTNTEVQDAEEPSVTESPEQETDSAANLRNLQQFGDFSGLTKGTEEEVVLENEGLKVLLSSKGGEIKAVELKEYKTWGQQPLILMDEENASINYQIQSNKGPLSLNDFYFEVDSEQVTVDEVPAQQVVFTAQIGNGSIRRIYTLSSEGYVMDHQISTKGLDNLLSDQIITIHWEDKLKKLEADIEESRRKSYINYYTADESYDYLGDGSSTEAEQVAQPVKWISFKQRFFTAGIIAEQQFSSGN